MARPQLHVGRAPRPDPPLRARPRRAGIGRRADVVDPAPWESGQDHVALYLYNGHEYLEGMVGAVQGPRGRRSTSTTATSTRSYSTSSPTRGSRAIVYHAAASRRALATVLPQLAADRAAAPGRRRQRRRRCSPARSTTRRRWPRLARAVEPIVPLPRRPLHPLHRRHDRHAQGRAVAPGRHLLRAPWAAASAAAPTSAASSTRSWPAPRAATWRARCPRRRSCTAPAHWIAFSTLHSGGTVIVQRPRPTASTPPTSGRPSSASRGQHALDRRRRLRAPALDRARTPTPTTSLAPACTSARAARSSRAAAEAGASSSSLPGAVHHRRLRLVGDRAPGRPSARRAKAPRPRRSATSRCDRHTCVVDERRLTADRSPPATASSAGSPTRGRVPARLPRRRGQDPAHLSRRSTACATPCPATAPGVPGRRVDRAARPRLGHASTPAARRSSPRRSSRPSSTTPPSTTWSWPGARASAGARRSWPWSPLRPGTTPTDDELVAERRRAHRPLQAAEGGRVRRRRAPQPQRQARLRGGTPARHRPALMVAAPVPKWRLLGPTA